ncbi:MAG: hypothetical protein JKY48_00100 [Flavobacteriales bacterium]|nr:hypothetical protein [Flavobacteriales bacterium]
MIEQTKRHIPATILMLLVLLIGGRYLFSSSMDSYPAYVHAWTQSDRLALAQNFQQNGFDFFHPATYNLLTKDGITQVDFPIHDYLVAIISSVFNSDLVPTFRWYTLLYSFLGIFFAFQLLLMFSNSATRSVLGASFLFTLPFLVYYENGFLPSAPSFANFIIGLYFVCASKKYYSKSQFVVGVLFISLAALARAPFFIFLFALFLQEIWQAFKQKKLNIFQVGIPVLGIASFLSYYFYNQHLAATYGSMFLSELLYFNSFSNFLDILQIAYERWGKQLMSPYHAVLFFALLIPLFIRLKNRGFQSNQNVSLVHYFLLSASGVVLFFFAFGQQFADHDYYYIDSFLPLVFMLLILGLSKLEIPTKWYSTVGSICIIFFFYFFSYAKQIQTLRYTAPYDDRIEYAHDVYESSKEDLSKWGVKPSDTLYVLEANSTNIPFTVFGNKGYTNLNSNAKFVSKELDSVFNYAVLIDSFLYSSTYKDYPEIIRRLERINGNGELSIYRKSNNESPQAFFENLVSEAHSDFDGSSNLKEEATRWISTESLGDSLGNSLKIQDINEYALTTRDTIRKKLQNKDLRVQIVADYFQTDPSRIQIVCRIGDFYGTHYTINEITEIGKWQKAQFNFVIDPPKFNEGDEIVIYFWNPEKTVLYVDNLNLIIYQ